jgi:hypothetical protein
VIYDIPKSKHELSNSRYQKYHLLRVALERYFHHTISVICIKNFIFTMTKELQDNECYVALTHEHLDTKSMMDRVRSPKAGAIVIFAGKVFGRL